MEISMRGSVSKEGQCPICERKDRILIRWEVGGFFDQAPLVWGCADNESCQRAVSEAKVNRQSEIPLETVQKLFAEA